MLGRRGSGHTISGQHKSCGFPGSSAGKEAACRAVDSGSILGSGRSAGEGVGYPLQYSRASLVAQLVKKLPEKKKETACNAGDLGSIPGSARSPGEGNGYPLQHSGLENSMDCIVHGVAELDTTFTFIKAVNHDSGA